MTVCIIGAVGTVFAQRPAANMSFFVTSSNPKGGNLGGLAGGDSALPVAGASRGRGRQDLARLSEFQHGGREDAHRQLARVYFQGRADCEQRGRPAQREQQHHGVHGAHRKGTAPNYLAGNPPQPVAQPLQHDILTGTNEDGTKNADTCRDWTVGNADAKAMLGHADCLGRNAGVNSWNQIHVSQGCGLEQLVLTGGAGLLDCFATN